MSDPVRDRIAAIILHERFRDGRVVRDDFNVDLVVAQILREFAVLHRSEETIEETEEGALVCGSGHEMSATIYSRDPKIIRNRAANLIALAEYIELVEREQNTRNKRRDELAAEFSFGAYAYGHSSPAMQSAIDHILDLEQKLGARA